MSKATVCDRCGKLMPSVEALHIASRRFGIMEYLDVCHTCHREFKALYQQWLREGREKR